MVSELDGEIITLVPATVGKVVPDGTDEEEWKWLVDATTRMLRPRQEGRRARSPSSRSTASRPISSTAPSRRWRWPTRSAPNAASASTPSTSTSRNSTSYEAIRKAGKRLFDFHVADNNRFAAGLGTLDWKKIVGTLKEIGYDGALTNEFVAPVDRTPANRYPDMVERNPVDISPEQLKFIQDHGSSVLTEEFYTDQMRITAETHPAADQVDADAAPTASLAAARRSGRRATMRISERRGLVGSHSHRGGAPAPQRLRPGDDLRRRDPAHRDR